MRKSNLFIALLIVTNLCFGASETIRAFQKQIKVAVFKAEHQLAAEIEKVIRENTNLNDVRVSTNMDIDIQLMINHFGLENLDRISKEKNLPGLDFDKGMILSKINQIKPDYEDIIKAIKKLNIKLSSYRKMSEKAQKVIKSSIDSYIGELDIPKIDVEFKKVDEFIKDGVLVKAELIEPKQAKGMSQENLFIYLVALFMSGFIVVTLIVVYMLRRVTGRLAQDLQKAMQQIEITTSSAAGSPSQANLQEKQSKTEGISSFTISETYDQLLDKIKLILDTDLAKFVAQHLMDGGEVKLFAVLSNCISSTEKELLIKDSSSYFQEIYDHFIRYEASAFVGSSEEMTLAAKNLYKLIWLAKENRDDFTYIMLDAKLRTFSDEQLEELILKLEDDEFSFILTLLSSERIAILVSRNEELISKFSNIGSIEQVSADVINRINEKIYDSEESDSEEEGKLSEISKYLPYELENRFNQAVGIESSAFDHLDADGKKKMIQLLNSMDMGSLKTLLPGLPEYLVEEFISQLPELKANRLRFGEFKTSQETLYLKNQLIRSLNENM